MNGISLDKDVQQHFKYLDMCFANQGMITDKK